MKHLVIPDVHEKLDKLAAIFGRHLDAADRVVFLGDWFDSFKKFDASTVVMVCRFINGNIDGGRISAGLGDVEIPMTFLIGNHDCHYFFRHDGFVCSGFDGRKRAIVNELIDDDTIRQFKLFHRVGNYLLSHAGYHYTNIHLADEHTAQASIEAAIRGEYPRIFEPGKARGGYAPIGGPTWQDWNWEFEHITDTPQIVGHTNGKDVRTKGDAGPLSYCIDTGLNHVAIIDDETNAVEIREVG